MKFCFQLRLARNCSLPEVPYVVLLPAKTHQQLLPSWDSLSSPSSKWSLISNSFLLEVPYVVLLLAKTHQQCSLPEVSYGVLIPASTHQQLLPTWGSLSSSTPNDDSQATASTWGSLCYYFQQKLISNCSLTEAPFVLLFPTKTHQQLLLTCCYLSSSTSKRRVTSNCSQLEVPSVVLPPAKTHQHGSLCYSTSS
jgi:hypothetical protein